MASLEAGITSVVTSKDGSAIVVNNVESLALCHFCNIAGEFGITALGALNSPVVYNKPQKWAVVFGGTRRAPKRFFICDRCAKGMVHRVK